MLLRYWGEAIKKRADVLHTGTTVSPSGRADAQAQSASEDLRSNNRPLRRAPQAGKRRDGLVTTQQQWSVLTLLPEELRFALNLCRGGRTTLLLLVPLRLRLLLLFGASLLTLGHGILLCCRGEPIDYTIKAAIPAPVIYRRGRIAPAPML